MKYYLIIEGKNIELEFMDNPVNSFNIGKKPLRIINKELTKVIDHCFLVGNCTLIMLNNVIISNGYIEYKEFKIWKT